MLSSIEADVYRIELIGAGREGSETRTLGVGRRGRAVYYQMQSYIMFLMPPFLLRAFTMGVLWPSLARILVNVQEDSCTQELMNGERAHMAAAAVTSQIMDAMDRDDLLLHESFMVFDCGGDGLISVGEFIRILKKMEPPLKIDRPKMLQPKTHEGERKVK